jgi:hypothetical protein
MSEYMTIEEGRAHLRKELGEKALPFLQGVKKASTKGKKEEAKDNPVLEEIKPSKSKK